MSILDNIRAFSYLPSGNFVLASLTPTKYFKGRNFREVKKARNFANLSFANFDSGRNFTDKTFANSYKIYLFWKQKLGKQGKF